MQSTFASPPEALPVRSRLCAANSCSFASRARAYRCSLARCPALGRSAFVQAPRVLQQRSCAARTGNRTLTRALQNVRESTFESEVLKIEKEQEGLKVVKTDADSCPSLVEKYKVYGLPTLMLFKDGKKIEASHREGAVTMPKLQEWLKQHGNVPAGVS